MTQKVPRAIKHNGYGQTYTRPSAGEILAQLVVESKPPEERKACYQVRACPPGKTETVVATSPLYLVYTHFVNGRTWPHLATGCICLKVKTEKRLKGYFAAYHVAAGEYFVYELPERAIRSCPGLYDGLNIVRKTLIISRIGSAPNGRVRVRFGDTVASFKQCRIPQIKPLEIMAAHWEAADKSQGQEGYHVPEEQVPLP